MSADSPSGRRYDPYGSGQRRSERHHHGVHGRAPPCEQGQEGPSATGWRRGGVNGDNLLTGGRRPAEWISPGRHPAAALLAFGIGSRLLVSLVSSTALFSFSDRFGYPEPFLGTGDPFLGGMCGLPGGGACCYLLFPLSAWRGRFPGGLPNGGWGNFSRSPPGGARCWPEVVPAFGSGNSGLSGGAAGGRWCLSQC